MFARRIRVKAGGQSLNLYLIQYTTLPIKIYNVIQCIRFYYLANKRFILSITSLTIDNLYLLLDLIILEEKDYS
jgi:hypothetical protein